MADAFEGFLLHPFAVVTHIFRKAGSAGPGTVMAQLFSCFRVDGRLPGELGRNFDHGLVDHHGHGVQIVGVSLQTKTLRLQRDRASPGERVKKSEGFIAHVFSDFRTGRFQYFLIIGVFPLHQLGQQRV